MTPDARDPGAIWFRVDDRLIHGQVTVGWRQYLRYAEIWVVDDLARDDSYLQDALRLAAPEGVVVRVYKVDEVVALKWPPPSVPPARPGGKKRGAQGSGVLLLIRSPEAALALVEGGVPMDRLNVGNLSSRPGSTRAFKNISLTPAHIKALDALAERGVCITFQLTPEDTRADWRDVRRRMRT